MVTIYYIILIFSVLLFASLLSLAVYGLFAKLAMFDSPQARSNHSRPVVTGVGLGFMTTIIGFLVVVNAPTPLVLGALALMVISVIDDRLSISAAKRLGFQAIAVLLALHLFDGQVFQGLVPVWLDMALTALLWLWMINLTNFMDGIDEMTVTQVSTMCLSVLLLGYVEVALPHALMVDALIILVAVLSFYPWNRHPATCFMGDAGSVPLGYLMGYLLLSLSAEGLWYLALILPAYPICDATVTLVKRALRKERLWEAHSEHYYQQAVRAGMAHHHVARRVLLLNGVLLLIAGTTIYEPALAPFAVGAAYLLAVLLCLYFARIRPNDADSKVAHDPEVEPAA